MADESDELRRLQRSLDALSSKVALLETRLDALEGPNIPLASAPTPRAVEPQPRESKIGLTLINRVGAFTLAIGIIFFFKYAADNEWIGPAGCVFIGLVMAFALLAAGDWLSKRDQRVFSQGILGCGLASLYISLYAASAYYKLIPQSLGFLLIIGTSVFALVLSFRYKNAFIAALGLAGAFLTILLLRKPLSGGVFELIYLLLIDVVAVVIALRQKWPVLILLNAACAILCGAILMRSAGAFVSLMLLLAVAHFAAARTAVTEAEKHSAYIAAHACTVLAGFRFLTAEMRNKAAATTVDSVLLAVYGIGLLAVGIFRRSAVDRGIGLVMLGFVVLKLYLVDIWLLQYGFRIVAFVVLGVLLLVASYVYSRWKTRTRMEAQP